jgi:hypothetical protein
VSRALVPGAVRIGTGEWRRLPMEERLRRLGCEIPGGWEDWQAGMQRRFVANQERRYLGLVKRKKEVRARADREAFRAGKLDFIPSDGAVPGQPRYEIRAVYGPLTANGKFSLIAVFPKEGAAFPAEDLSENLPRLRGARRAGEVGEALESKFDNHGQHWGPRRFLFEVFQAAAAYGGDCTIHLAHDKTIEIGLDPESFEDWIKKANETPEDLIAMGQPLNLLQGS